VQARALRTNATTQEVLQVALQDCGYSLRQDSPYAAVLARQREDAEHRLV
jgi:hypothetical protein